MSLFAALSIGASGMAAERVRAEALTENLANAETTRTPAGWPLPAQGCSVRSYARIVAVFLGVRRANAIGGRSAGVGCRDGQSAPEMRFLPGHPDANAEGYVAFPHVNPAEDMVDLMGAARNYEANVAAMSAVKDMIQKSIDLLH